MGKGVRVGIEETREAQFRVVAGVAGGGNIGKDNAGPWDMFGPGKNDSGKQADPSRLDSTVFL